jgi:lincosamide nucleotidyltransferase A/C/D/E
VTEILDRLAARGIEVSVDGGWGVDALLGEQTRAHDDLDLVITRGDCSAAQDALAPLSGSSTPRPPSRGCRPG